MLICSFYILVILSLYNPLGSISESDRVFHQNSFVEWCSSEYCLRFFSDTVTDAPAMMRLYGGILISVVFFFFFF